MKINCKKLVATITAVATMATSAMSIAGSTISASAEEKTACVTGDFTGNGKVDYYDVASCLQNLSYFYANYDFDKLDDLKDPAVFKSEYQKSFNISDEDYASLDLNSDGKLDSMDACTLLQYTINIKVGYTGELEQKAVQEFFLSLPEDQITKLEEEQFNEMHALGLVRTNAEVEEELRKYDEEVASRKIYTNCDLNHDGILDEKDEELMRQNTYGDVNHDGVVDAKDAVGILSNYANILVSSGTSNNTASAVDMFVQDMNGDGVIDSRDAVEILQEYANSLVKGN